MLVVLGVTGLEHCRACAKTPVANAVLTEVRKVGVVVMGVEEIGVAAGA